MNRFQSINPEKDGANVKGPSDIKNEIRIITLADDVFKLWEKFFDKHCEGSLIDPCTGREYREDKKFNPSKFFLKREFFKHMGHFTDKDLKEYALHLLGQTVNRDRIYPKVSFHKTRVLCEDNHCAADWVERRKRKKVVLDELMTINSLLKFKNENGDVIDRKWRDWKRAHLFTSASWDFLIAATPNEFFKKRLTNEAKNKRAVDFTEKYPTICPMLERFLKLKNRINHPRGGVCIRGHSIEPMSFTKNHRWEYVDRTLHLAIIDFRQVPKPLPGTSNNSIALSLLKFLGDHLRPSMSSPTIWLWIVGDAFDLERVTAFAATHMKDFDLKKSKYFPSKAERLDSVTSRSEAAVVTLLFLFKKGSEHVAKVQHSWMAKYSASSSPYYLEPSKNNEGKYRHHAAELRMEFYLNILQSFAYRGDNIIGIYVGTKCMIAAKVQFHRLSSFVSSNRR